MRNVIRAVPLVVLCALIIAAPPVWAYWVQDGVALCTATGERAYPTIVSDGAGGTIVTWEDWRSVKGGIYAQRTNASGDLQWTSDGIALCTATGGQYYPMIISDDSGGAIVTWGDWRSGSGNSDIYAQRTNASGDVKWTTDGVSLCTAGRDQYPITIISDGLGGAIVTWMDYRSGGDADIYAQRVNATGAIQWTADGVAICTAAGAQGMGIKGYPTTISDGAGGAIVTWFDYRSGRPVIYAQRVDASGAVRWTVDGVAICTAAGDQGYPTITSDGAGGALVTWEDWRNETGGDIYAQRVNALGVVQWTTDGVALCTATRIQYYPTITSDGSGGAIVTWLDYRSGSTDDIYAQRVNASGAVQWTTDGVALRTATGGGNPQIISDGGGGAIVTWPDVRGAGGDIYAQKVDASGAVEWTANGIAICTAEGNQGSPMITSNGSGGAIVTWNDYRNGSWDVFAQKVDANGFALLTATDTPTVPVELHQNYPNPFNPATTVTYSIAKKGNVTLRIYDVSGKCIACLVDRQQEKGFYAVEWNGKDEKGNSVASGIYIYRLAASNQTISRKMVLLK